MAKNKELFENIHPFSLEQAELLWSIYSTHKSKHSDKIKPNQHHLQIQGISYIMP